MFSGVLVLLSGALLCCSDLDPGPQVSDVGDPDSVTPGSDGRPELGIRPEAGPDAALSDGIGPLPDVGLDAGSDPDGPAPDGPALDAGPPVFSHKAVATTTDPGFFSLRSFNGQLLAGTYGTGKIYSSSNAWAAPLVDLNVGESVYVMWPFSSMLYANTENRGEIWRTPGGKTWNKVFNGASTAIGTGLAVYNGQLYAAYTTLSNSAGRIYRSSTGDPGTWTHVFGSSSQGTDVTLRELTVYKKVLYCLSYDWQGSIGGFYTTTNGTTWKWHPKLANHRPIKAHVWNGYLWISTSPYNGKRVPPASVYRWDGTSLVNVFQDKARAVGADLLDFNGALYFVDMVNWRATKGAAALHRSPTGAPGTWQTVLTFPEPEAMDMEVFGGDLHVTTRHEGGHGKVYRVEIK
jgi:hypothetical protein